MWLRKYILLLSMYTSWLSYDRNVFGCFFTGKTDVSIFLYKSDYIF